MGCLNTLADLGRKHINLQNPSNFFFFFQKFYKQKLYSLLFDTMAHSNIFPKFIRKSIAITVIILLITLSFTSPIISASIIKSHKNMIINHDDKHNSWKVSSSFCFIIMDGDFARLNLFMFLFYEFLYSNKGRFPILYEIYLEFLIDLEDIMEDMSLALLPSSIVCNGNGDIITIGANGIKKDWYQGFIILFGFKGIWYRGIQANHDLVFGFSMCVLEST